MAANEQKRGETVEKSKVGAKKNNRDPCTPTNRYRSNLVNDDRRNEICSF